MNVLQKSWRCGGGWAFSLRRGFLALILTVEEGWGSESGEQRQARRKLSKVQHPWQKRFTFMGRTVAVSASRRDDLATGSLNRRFQLGLCAWQAPRSYFNRSYKGRGLGKTCGFWSELTIFSPLVASRRHSSCGRAHGSSHGVAHGAQGQPRDSPRASLLVCVTANSVTPSPGLKVLCLLSP